MHVAQFAYAPQVGRVVHAHAAGALQQRLQHQRADFSGVLVQQVRQCIRGFLRAGLRALPIARQVGVGSGREDRLHQQWCVDAAIQRDVAHRQCADGFAVVTVVQGDELRPPRFVAAIAEPVERHFQRDLDPGRAVVGIEDLGQRIAPGFARRDGKQPFGQFHRGRMRKAGQDHLFKRARLSGHRLGDARFGVSVQVDPPATDRVQVLAAVLSDQPGPVAAGHGHERQGVRACVRMVRAHLRAWMPEHREIARTPAVRVVARRVV